MGEAEGCVSFLLYSKIGAGLWREISQLSQAQKWPIREFADRPLTLEETFLTLTEKEAAGATN